MEGVCTSIEILEFKSAMVSRFVLVRRAFVADVDIDAGMENPTMEEGLNAKAARAAALLRSFIMENNYSRQMKSVFVQRCATSRYGRSKKISKQASKKRLLSKDVCER